MVALGLLLLALGTSDAVSAGLVGHPPRRRWAGPVVGVAVAAVAGLAVGAHLVGLSAAVALTVLTVGLWTYLRARRDSDIPAAWAGLAVLIIATMSALVVPVSASGGAVARLLQGSDADAIRSLDAGMALLGAGVLAALGATANATVRLVLVLAGPEVLRSRGRLRGGRLIGPLERYLILGLVVAGSPTAAGLVVAAKSVLRFPELASSARDATPTVVTDAPAVDALDRVDAVTEYVLIGSLVSWSLALLPAVLLRG